jgi:hypothetical protein
MNNNSVGESKERYLADKDGNQSSPTRLPGSGTSGHKGRPNERLPDGFASQIIELEIEVDRSDVSIETVNE